MKKNVAIIICIIIVMCFIKIHQKHDDKSVIGIWAMIGIYIFAFEMSNLILAPIKKLIEV